MGATNLAVLLAAFVLFAIAAVKDFQTWKIPNSIVLALVCLYGFDVASKAILDAAYRDMMWSWQHVGGDVAAGILLFVLGIVLWLFRMFGAGDAKLFLPIGLFIGWIGLMPFSVLLIIFGVLALFLLRMPIPLAVRHYAVMLRIDEIRSTRKVPYGVVMVPSAIITMIMRWQAGI